MTKDLNAIKGIVIGLRIVELMGAGI